MRMPSEVDASVVMKKGEKRERKGDWLKAAKLYEQVLSSGSAAGSFAAEIWERIGFCYGRASTQAEDLKKFKEIRKLAVEAYKGAAKLFEKERALKNQGRSARCNAIAEYLRSWLASNPSEKRSMLYECCLFGNESLKAFEEAGDDPNYGKTCNDLLLCLLEMLYVSFDWTEMRKIAQEGIDCADKAVRVLLKLENKSELLRAYFAASLQSWYAHAILEKRDEIMQRSLSYSEKALKLSNEVDDPYYVAMANWAAAFSTLFFTAKVESSLEYAKEMLRQAMRAKDNYLKGVASYVLVLITNWIIVKEGDPDKRKEGHQKIIKYAEDAIGYLQSVSQDFFMAQTYSYCAETYSSLARDAITSPEEKSAILEKAIEIGRKGLEYATCSGSPDCTGTTLHALSKALHFYSNLETRKDEKTELLQEALVHRREYVNIVEKAFASNDWIYGVGKNYEGLIEADLAGVESDKEKKRAILESAVSDMEDGVSRCGKWIVSHPVPTLVAAVARFEDWFGGILNELYLLTEDKEILSRANEIYEDAAEKFKKVNLPSRVAESYWRMARNEDCLGEYQKAAKNFEKAFAEYKAASQRISHLVEFYLDYAAYMRAWSEIERAKFAHKQEQYATAMKHYEKTANLLGQSKLWSHLSSNFLAWSLLERAEDLSRRQSTVESIEAFKKATELFREAWKNLRVKFDRIENADEKDLAKKLIEASDTRGKYCLGRIAIEEGKVLDRQGDHSGSAKKYESAAETFQRIARDGTENTRKELTPLIYLCQAWQKMMMAEATASPIMYEEAAELFGQAKEHTLDQRASLLALAHSRFCKALEAGTEFEITRDMTMYSTTKEHIEAAANYYLKAGFKIASEYAKATQLLFDAYIYMDNAQKETDPAKEARYYAMAEKVLQISAGSYTKAKHPEKAELVHRFLEKVREGRELAVSLSEVLHAPAVTSSTTSSYLLTPTEETPVGLERFEHANLQAKLVQPEKDIRIGKEFNLKMQVANVGKQAVLLAKIEDVVPRGFQLVDKPDYCHFEDSYLGMKGKRLDPLNSEDIKIVLRPFDKGTFEITPRIVFMDENGHKMLCEPEPVTVTVSEVVLPGRTPTGYADLDNLLLGGIPENYAVILTSPSCDERDVLIKKFLESGAKGGQVTFYITIEATGVRALAQEYQSNFYLFICNPRADTMVKSLPNVFKLKGVENITNIEIALISAFRRLEKSPAGPRRACIEIISDVLLHHHAVTTRRWLSGLIPDLRSKGFTTLAVMNPQMHPAHEVHAILGLFEGEINIYEKETTRGLERFLKIRKMYNQRYLESDLPLRQEN